MKIFKLFFVHILLIELIDLPVTLSGGFCCKPSKHYSHYGSEPKESDLEEVSSQLSFEGRDHAESSNPGNCECNEYSLRDFRVRRHIKYNSKVIMLRVRMNESIGDGRDGKIFHAYWENISSPLCVALKIMDMSETRLMSETQKQNIAKNEAHVLEYLSSQNLNNIITMYGYQIRRNRTTGQEFMNIVLELGGMNLDEYFNKMFTFENTEEQNEVIITNMLKCAAYAIQQIHDCGVIHLDIKANNFVIPRDHNLGNPFLTCKIIDFASSMFISEEFVAYESVLGTAFSLAPEMERAVFPQASKKSDVYAFGAMIYKFLRPNEDYDNYEPKATNLGNGRLDYLSKACIKHDQNERPTINTIIRFLNLECDYFPNFTEHPHPIHTGQLCQN